MDRTWLKHKESGGYFHCPNDVVDEMAKKGWEPSEAPEEHNPAVAEALAWRAEQAAAAQAEARNTKSKAAAGGKAEKE